jgi:hypothetical protein
MDWIATIFQPETLLLLMLIIVVICGFVMVALKAHHRHEERIEKIKHGFDPDI